MQGIIHKAGWLVAAIVSVVALAAVAGVVHGGPLDPPGPPASTAGVLRPGTPITAIPFTISQPGNYYLTHDLSMTASDAGDGITISVSDVTLDLGGFNIDGGTKGGDGITTVGSNAKGITIRNGSATHWGGYGFNLANPEVAADHIRSHNNANGILIFGTLSDCSADSNTGTGVLIDFGTAVNCEASVNGTGFDIAIGSLTHCVSDDNTATGISIVRGTVADCTVDSNAGDGILANGLANVHDNTVTENGANGIRVNSVGSLIENNELGFNGQKALASGIYVSNDQNRIVHNTVSGSHIEGIAVDGSFNTIDENSAFGNQDIGIKIGGSKNTVVRNSSTGNGPSVPATNYSIGAGNNPGPIDAANASTNSWSNTQ